MLSKIRRHLSFANVVSVIALFVALGGVAYAAGTIGSADVINNSLRSVDLKDGAAVDGVDVVDGSLTGADIHSPSLGGDQVLDDSLTGFQIDESTLDLPGVQERAKRIDYSQPDTDATMRQIGYQNGLYLY